MQWRRNTQSAGPLPMKPERVRQWVRREWDQLWLCKSNLLITHSLQVLLFGLADVTADFLIQSKHHLLRKGHGSDCVWALQSIRQNQCVRSGRIHLKWIISLYVQKQKKQMEEFTFHSPSVALICWSTYQHRDTRTMASYGACCKTIQFELWIISHHDTVTKITIITVLVIKCSFNESTISPTLHKQTHITGWSKSAVWEDDRVVRLVSPADGGVSFQCFPGHLCSEFKSHKIRHTALFLWTEPDLHRVTWWSYQ